MIGVELKTFQRYAPLIDVVKERALCFNASAIEGFTTTGSG